MTIPSQIVAFGAYVGHCPSGDNPRTAQVETNCEGVQSPMSRKIGLEGNLCQVDCSNLGTCDFDTGTCLCFQGQYGNACNLTESDLVEFANNFQPWRVVPTPEPPTDDEF
jgi:hypothetical protein